MTGRRPGLALNVVESSGRDALVELRRIMGVVRRTDDELDGAAPGLAALEALVARTQLCQSGRRAAGPRAAVVPLFRPASTWSPTGVVQESLTNSLKHSGSPQALVRVIFREGGLELEISEHGPSPVHGSPNAGGSGQGLVGMRERVTLFGGELLAGSHCPGRVPGPCAAALAGIDPWIAVERHRQPLWPGGRGAGNESSWAVGWIPALRLALGIALEIEVFTSAHRRGPLALNALAGWRSWRSRPSGGVVSPSCSLRVGRVSWRLRSAEGWRRPRRATER